MNKAVFLDKDGTLIPDIPYNTDTSLITLTDGTVDGLKKLQHEGYLLVVVSNQAGIAYGYFAEEAIKEVELTLREMLLLEGIKLSGFYYCPHHPEGKVETYSKKCVCRKPEAGMLLEAAEALSINLHHSWMIGDILNDVEAGHKAGCRAILIDNGNETEWVRNEYRNPDFTTTDISKAADYILSCGNS